LTGIFLPGYFVVEPLAVVRKEKMFRGVKALEYIVLKCLYD